MASLTIIYLLSIGGNFDRLWKMKTVEILKQSIAKNNFSHAYLFIGSDWKKIEELINCIFLGLKCFPEDKFTIAPDSSIDKSGEIKVEQVKNLLHSINLSGRGKCKIAIIRDCHRLNSASANKLLKSLEEPPGKVIFILTSQTNSVLPTIKSRCRVFILAARPERGEVDIEKFTGQDFASASKEIEEIIKEEKIDQQMDQIELFVREKMLLKRKKKYVQLIRYLYKIKSDIRKNANARLSLECLWLILNQTMKSMK